MRKLLRDGAAALVALLIGFSSGPAWADAGTPPREVMVLKFFSNHGWAAAYELAGALGWLKDKGIEVKSVGFAQGGPEAVFGLNNGSVQIADAATASLINAVAGGPRSSASCPILA